MATPPKTKRHRGTEAPKCELCGTRHWLRDGHATTAVVPVVGPPAERILSLQTLGEASRMLAEMQSLEDVRQIRGLAEAARAYARAHHLGIDAENHAGEIAVEAAIRQGEILDDMLEKGLRRGPGRYGRGKSSIVEPLPSFPELGTTKSESAVVHRLAARKVAVRAWREEASKKEEKTPKERISVAAAVRVVKAAEREEKRELDRLRVAAAPPLAQIAAAGQRFQTIVVDPPWDWGDEGDADQFGRSRPPYATMPFEDVRSQPVGECAEPNAHLYLWITNRSLPKGFALLDAWGFRYVTILTWCKPSIGMGNYFRNSTEQVLFGVKGSLPLLRRDVGTFFNAPRPTEHSEKPDAFYELIESLSPGPWLDAFGRKNRPGWYVWGSHAT